MEPEPNTSKAASFALSKAAVTKAVPNTSKAASLASTPCLMGVPPPPPDGFIPSFLPPPPPGPPQSPQFQISAGGCIGIKMPPPQPPFLQGPPGIPMPGSGLAVPPPPTMQPPDITAAELVAAVDAAMARVVAGPSHDPHPGLPMLPAPAPLASAGPMEQVEWEAHKSPQGLPYFFCRKTGESRWVKPTGPQDVIVEAAAPKAEPAKASAPSAPATSMKDRIGEPESWETIGKTGWSRVQTDKGFTYFYHKKQKKTSWTCPPEIERDVAELDGCLGALDEAEAETKEESDTKEEPEQPEHLADEVPKEDAQDEVPQKPSRAERAEKRAQQVEEEQKIAKEKEKLRNFKQLLLEKGVKAFDKYEKWLPKLVHDPRFCAVTGQKERKLLFEMLAKRIDSEKRKTQAVSKLKGREAFKELVAKADEMELLHGRTVDRALSAMERRFGDDERWDSVPEPERQRIVSEAVEEATKRVEKQKDEARATFRALVQQTLAAWRKDGQVDVPAFSKARRHFESDASWSKLSSSDREGIYNRVVRELDEARRKQRAKQRQIQLEVEEARKKRKLTETEEKVFSVLAERVKNPFSLTWEEAKEELGDLDLNSFSLKDEELEPMFLDYQRRAIDARREAWICILDNAGFDAIGPELEFEEVVQRAFDARTDAATARAFHGMPEEVLKAAWIEWRERAYDLAVEDCQKWLRTCEHLRGCEDVEPTGGDDFDRLLRRLAAKDVRFRRLHGRPEQQTRLLAGRLRELRSLREKGHSKEDEEMDE